jgi:hypothetical protein
MSRFNSEAAEDVLEAIRLGSSIEVAAAHANLPLQTVRDWYAGGTPAKDEFRAQVDKARATLEMLAVGHVRRNMDENPAAAMQIAERVKGEAEFERLRELTT